jgi:hypothetical protein
METFCPIKIVENCPKLVVAHGPSVLNKADRLNSRNASSLETNLVMSSRPATMMRRVPLAQSDHGVNPA